MKKILEYFVIILLILNCNTVISTLDPYKDLIRIALVICLFLLVIVCMLSNVIQRNKILKAFIFLVVYYIFIFFFMYKNSISGTFDFIFNYCFVFPLFYFLFSTSKNIAIEMLKKFSKIMILLAIMSLFFYLFGTIGNIIKPNNSILLKWGNPKLIYSYFNFHYNIQKTDIFELSFWRNTGIFAEAPMFSLNLVIALTFELFINKKNIKDVFILLIAIFTSFSITGIVLSLGLICVYIFLSKEKIKIKKFLKIMLLPIIVLSVTGISYKILVAKQQTSSYLTRMDDYKASYLAWKDSPIYGNGYRNDLSIQKYMSNFRHNNLGLSNSLMVLLAQCGIYLFIFYFMPILKLIKISVKNKNLNLLAFGAIIIVLFVTTIFLYKALMMFLLALGYSLQKGEETNEV